MNHNQRIRTQFLMIGGAVAVLLLVALFFATDFSDNSGSTSNGTSVSANRQAEEQQVLRTDILLHSQFSRLQQLDEEYNVLLFNNSGAKSIDSISELITQTEMAFQQSLDSVKAKVPEFNGWSNVMMLDSITTAFNSALANRKYFQELRNSLAGKKFNPASEQKEMMQLQMELKEKSQQLTALERQLREKAPKSGSTAAANDELEKYESSLKNAEQKNAGLMDELSSLRTENQKLSNSLAQAKSSVSSDASAATEATAKVRSLQEQIDDLNAELNFARVDCNLSRADATKIISNSRQRKELLNDALKSLQGLSKSESEYVQRKAKEKLTRLNEIASTVRD